MDTRMKMLLLPDVSLFMAMASCRGAVMSLINGLIFIGAFSWLARS